MAAPTATARQTPAGIPLKSGHPTKVTISLDPDISFWEVEVTPVGLDGGPSIDQTTMFNTTFMTKAEGDLVDVTDLQGTCAYDPAVLSQIIAVINRPAVITERYKDGSTYAYHGYLQSFTRQSHVRGQQPRATFTIVATNWDGTAEQAPVLTSVAGT